MSDFEFYVPLLSLVNQNGEPEVDFIKAHLCWLKQNGANGILVMGTTGEFPNFTVAQRKRYLETVLDFNPDLKLMANVGAACVQDVLDLQAHALSHPQVDSILWMPPFYYTDEDINGLNETIQFVLSHQPPTVPFLFYHYPKLSQVHITPEILDRFPQASGLKDTSGDFERIGSLVKRFPEKRVYVGTDFQIQRSMQLGCTGVISSMGNAFPNLIAQSIQGIGGQDELLKTLRQFFNTYRKIPALKAYLNHMGFSSQRTDTVLPYRNLTPEEVEHLVSAIESVQQKV